MEALANVNEFGVCELGNEELIEIDGGIDWGAVGVGIAAVGVAVAIASTAGLATVPVAVIAGAGTAGEILVAGAACGLAGGGGAAIGYGLTN